MATSPRILVVADDSQVGRWLQHRIEAQQNDCTLELDDGAAFQRRLATSGTGAFDLLFAALDFATPAEAFAWIDRVQDIPETPPLVVVADNGDELTAVGAMRRGCVDYIPRRLLDTDHLASAFEHAAAARPAPAPPPAAAQPAGGTVGAMTSPLKVPPELIPRYRLLDTLGESARATVYLAHSEALNRHVALKVSRVAEDDQPQFAREFEAVGSLSHPGVVDIYDYGVHEGREYIAMEYFPCGDLKARLQNPLSEDEALAYVRRIAAALSAVHARGMVHRDLKPPNIMLREDGSVVLIDFGLAKNVDANTHSTAVGVLRGSPYYMSPEQAQGLELDARSDLYSLGVIFHEMLTGAKPYLGATAVEVLQQHVTGPLPELPAEFAAHQPLLEGMMAKSRDDRFASADDLLARLSQAAA